MSRNFLSRYLPKLAVLFMGLLLPATAQHGDAKDGLRLKLICINSLVEGQEVVLASRDDDGKWHEQGTVQLRSSSVSDWMPAKSGELHLALREGKSLKSLCHFTSPAAAHRALIVLRPNEGKDAYEVYAVDPQKAGFVKTSTLIVNFSQNAALVRLGADERKIEAGQELAVKPVLDDGGMYHLTVARLDAEGKSLLCHDRYVSGNPDSRDMVFLLPHKSRGIRVVTLPLLGSFD